MGAISEADLMMDHTRSPRESNSLIKVITGIRFEKERAHLVAFAQVRHKRLLHFLGRV